MNEAKYQDFFLQPAEPRHRQYEALRAYFVEQQPLRDVAERFGVGYGTACNWVSQFRAQQNAGQGSPFLFRRFAGGHDPAVATGNRRFKSRRWKRCP